MIKKIIEQFKIKFNDARFIKYLIFCTSLLILQVLSTLDGWIYWLYPIPFFIIIWMYLSETDIGGKKK